MLRFYVVFSIIGSLQSDSLNNSQTVLWPAIKIRLHSFKSELQAEDEMECRGSKEVFRFSRPSPEKRLSKGAISITTKRG